MVTIVGLIVALLYQKINVSHIRTTFICVALFSISYTAILLINGLAESLSEAFVTLLSPICFYLAGSQLARNNEKRLDPEKITLILITSFALLTYIRTFQSINALGVVNASRVLVFGNKEVVLSATLYGLNVAFGLTGLALFIFHKHSIYRLVYLLIFTFSILLVIHLVNRTGIVLAGAAVVLCFVYSLKYKKLNFSTVILLLFLASCVFWFTGNADVNSAYEARADSVSSGGGRSQLWEASIECLLKYPGGWVNEPGAIQQYAHNLWLDIARQTGWIPFIFMLIASIAAIRKMYILLMNDKNMQYIWLFTLNGTFFLAAMVEPVIEALPSFLYIGAFLWGLQDEVAKRM